MSTSQGPGDASDYANKSPLTAKHYVKIRSENSLLLVVYKLQDPIKITSRNSINLDEIMTLI